LFIFSLLPYIMELFNTDRMDTDTRNSFNSGKTKKEHTSLSQKTIEEAGVASEFDCSLCLKLLYQPATLPCGHTFCRHCIGKATSFSNKCPLCRTVYHSNFRPPVTVTLQNIIQKLYPKEYQFRAKEVAEEEDEDNMTIPLFVMDALVFPGEEISLHVYEPRYRVMLDRVMQGCRQFGLIQAVEDKESTDGYSLSDVGCCLEVTHCDTLPDGRSLIRTRSIKRFKVNDRWTTDGYWVAKVEFLEDSLPGSEQELNTARTLIARVQQLVALAISQNQGQQDFSQLEQVVNSVDYRGASSSDCGRYTAKICTLLPISPALKQPLLEIDSCVDRLYKIIALLERVAGSSSCGLL